MSNGSNFKFMKVVASGIALGGAVPWTELFFKTVLGTTNNFVFQELSFITWDTETYSKY